MGYLSEINDPYAFGKIGRNMEVYINNMLVKSMNQNYHINNLMETFDTLRRFRMMLNLKKCVLV